MTKVKNQPQARQFSTSHDLAPDARKEIVALLNARLADTLDLYTQTKQAHWNVKGKHFYTLHQLFDALAEGLLPFVDEIAERATALGGTALGTARMAGANSQLPEYPPGLVEGHEHLEALIAHYAMLARATRVDIGTAMDLGDADTADLLTEFSRLLDKDLWFLEAHLQG